MKISAFAAVLLALLLPAGDARPDAAGDLRVELRLRALIRAGHDGELLDFASDRNLPGNVRGRAFCEAFARREPPLSAGDRRLVLQALADPAPEVRRASLRSISRLGERTLEREALKRAAEDPAPEVRAEALRAVRPWTRRGHLYYLEEAVSSPSTIVQAEALRSLKLLEGRELTPEVLATVVSRTRPGNSAEVRAGSLDCLDGWGRLEWTTIRDILLEPRASLFLRLHALSLGRRLRDRGDFDSALLGVVGGEASSALVSEAFQQLRNNQAVESELASRLVQFLSYSRAREASTEAMAQYLRARGYAVEYRSGAWKVGGR